MFGGIYPEMDPRCSECKPGGDRDGGVQLVDGVCHAFCSTAGFCGGSQLYAQGLDCRKQPMFRKPPVAVAPAWTQRQAVVAAPHHAGVVQQQDGQCKHAIPGFVIPGVEKGGTTALFNFMIRHPNVLPKKNAATDGPESEVLFLGELWDRGGSRETTSQRKLRYQSLFQRPPHNRAGTGCTPNDPLYLAVDKTPSYMALPDGVQKLHAIAPEAKIIISLREPVARAISAFRYFDHFQSPLSVHIQDEISLVREFGVTPENSGMEEFNKFNDALLTRFKPHRRYHRGAIVGFGLYVVMLKQWMSVYPKDRFRVVFLEEWQGAGHETVEAVNSLFDWLGLEPMQDLGDTAHGINSTPKRASASKPVKEEDKRRLIEFYRPFNEALEELLGRKVPDSWKH